VKSKSKLQNLARFEQVHIAQYILRWSFIAGLVGIMAGSASALFLASLEWATDLRNHHLWLIALLPLGGFVIGWIYHLYGKDVEAGNNLLIDEIHDPKKTIQLRMAPLVLVGTVATHLFGGSAGREGTALQMGGSLADQLAGPLKLSPENRRVLLMAGISAGFASVFGTPLAGTVFGFEVLAIGRLRYDAIFPCLLAALVGNEVTLAWGIHHTPYLISTIPALTGRGVAESIAAGAAFGIVGMLFAKVTHAISHFYKQKLSYAPHRPLWGGVLVSILIGLMGLKYAGLGIPTIVQSFETRLPPWDFAGKFLLTSLTLGAGFKGGEVTPLFYIGATLGNALSYLMHLPTPLLAGMGFVAVFAGAANTPIASTLMAIELFGSNVGIYAAIACFVSYLFSGHTGIYRSQRVGHRKASTPAQKQNEMAI
jgi:H+/Cl- antiporter ClcA